MKKTRLLLVISLVCVVASNAQNLDYAKEVVKKLASPEMKGRGYVDNGNGLAAQYIADEFLRWGLKPLADNYFQKFSIPVNTFPGAMSVKLNGETLKPGNDFLVEASSPGIKGTFAIVQTDRSGIDSKEKMIALIRQVKECFILIDNTRKTTEDAAQNKLIDNYIAILKYNPQITCKGVIIFTKEKLTWDAATSMSVRPVIVVNKVMDPKTITAVELNVENRFIEQFGTQNIAGYIKGSDNSDSLIVVTAHYDHLGKMGKETCFPGANDNASGVAMLLNLAQHYAKHTPRYSMLFLALSAEETGLLGAKYFTEHPLVDLHKIKFLVNFDLAGTGEEGVRVVNGSVYRDKFDLLTKINTESKLLPRIDIRGVACNSDHCLFYQKGVPCFYIYTQGGIKAYHDIYDRYETLPFTEFVDYCSLMIRFFDAM